MKDLQAFSKVSFTSLRLLGTPRPRKTMLGRRGLAWKERTQNIDKLK